MARVRLGDTLHSRFPTTLPRVRTEHGETQAQLGEAVAVKRAYIALWESGVQLPSYECYRRIYEHYGGHELYPPWVVETIERLASADWRHGP